MQGKCPGWRGEGHDDLYSCYHSPLEGLAVFCTTVPIPDSDTAGQHALNGTPVESGEDGRRKCRRCCAFLESDVVLVV